MIEGMPMIEHVYRRSRLASGVDEVVMAICEDRVFEACQGFGAKVVMTSTETPTAVDRVAEAARLLDHVRPDDVVINVQGDEPVVPPPVIKMTIELLRNDGEAACANMVEVIQDLSDLANHHRIKAVISVHNRLLYLTRQSIPATVFDIHKKTVFYRQTCVMAFRGDFLQKFTQLPRTYLELIEGIDMLRVIESDLPVATGIAPYVTQPVDTPDDVPKVVEMLKTDPWFRSGYRN
jgi:3-deoxy-manno-octulosonate cytidylyltransferase (CMP-KDO synthetase)